MAEPIKDLNRQSDAPVANGVATLPVLLICAVLTAGTILAFWGVKDAAFVNYDDPQYITQNPIVQRGLTAENVKWAFTTFYFHNWHPLTWLSYMLDCELFGVSARAMHLVNVGLHIANTLLVFLLLRRLTGAMWASGIVAGFFAWHPMHVESVAWIAERKDVLSTLFWLLTMWAYAEYTKRQSRGWYGGMLVLFALGLMSKAMLVTLPFALLLMDVWPLRRLEIGAPDWLRGAWRLAVEKIPMFAMAAATSYAAYWAQAGAVIATQDLTLLDRVGNAVVSYARYLGKTVWPTDLAVFYPPGIWPLWQSAFVAVVLVLVSAAAIKSVRDKPHFFMGWFWFLGTLVPVIGLVQVGSQSIADRYMYVPSIGLYAAIIWSVRDQLAPERQTKVAAGVFAGAALIACIALSARQVGHWHNSVSLFTQAERVTPPNVVTLNNLIAALRDAGRTNEANQRILRSIQEAPQEELTWKNAGYMAFAEGRLDEALGYYRRGLQLKPYSPDLNMSAGIVLDRQGKTTEALEYYRRAVQVAPRFPAARMNLAKAMSAAGDRTNAISNYATVVEMYPSFAAAHSELGKLYLEDGQVENAVRHLRRAVEIRPDDAEAQEQLQRALKEAEKTQSPVDQRPGRGGGPPGTGGGPPPPP